MIPLYAQAAAAAKSGRDPHWMKVGSLLHFNGANASTSFADQKGKVWTREGTPTISTAQSMFGGASGLFNGTDQAITTPDHADFNFGQGDFTVEGFFRANAFPSSSACLFVKNDPVSAAFGLSPVRFDVGGNGVLYMFASYTGAAWDVNLSTAAGEYALNVWNHLVYQRRNGNLELFLGGTKKLTAAVGTNALWTNTFPFRYAGRNHSGTPLRLNGYMDEWRVTKGVGRYAGNFTPPVAAYPNS